MSDVLVALIVYNNAVLLRKKIDTIMGCPFAHAMPLIIDDGSDDESPDIVSDYDIHFVMHEQPLGYGGALITAIEYAKDYGLDSLFLMPLEAFVDWSTLIRYMQFFQEADIITGNRIVSEYDLKNRQYSKIVTYFNSKTGLHVIDPFSPVKGILLKHVDLFEITEFSDIAMLQILIQAAHFKLRIKEFECVYPESALISHIERIETLNEIENFIDGEVYLYPFAKGH